MKILLAGDSWGVGTYGTVNGQYQQTGSGIQGILESKGYKVINVSKSGDSNNNIVDRIQTDVDHIIFIQTDIFRDHCNFQGDLKILQESFLDQLLEYNSINDYIEHYFNCLYSRLNNFSTPILCVGGWSKLHPCLVNYDKLIPVIPSATEFLLPQAKDVYLSDFEWFLQLNDHTKIMNKFDSEIKRLALESTAKFDLINQIWGDVHPTQVGYELLVEKIQKYLL